MKDKMKDALTKAKNHVKIHKFGYVMTIVAAGALALNYRNGQEFTKFLVEKGIDPLEYFNPEYLEEMKIN